VGVGFTDGRLVSMPLVRKVGEPSHLSPPAPSRLWRPRRGWGSVVGRILVGLGINKDLEPLVREVRRRGGSVEVTGSNHVRWSLGEWRFRKFEVHGPDGPVLNSSGFPRAFGDPITARRVRNELNRTQSARRRAPAERAAPCGSWPRHDV
jgi:hypothetical protein